MTCQTDIVEARYHAGETLDHLMAIRARCDGWNHDINMAIEWMHKVINEIEKLDNEP